MHRKLLMAVAAAGVVSTAQAKPEIYTIDSAHTYPSFEAPHSEQLSLWRGKFNKSSGKLLLDRENRTGTVDITIDAASVDFGHDMMNVVALGPDYFNVEKYPTATYKGTLVFKADAPTEVQGELTLLGVTKPLNLKVNWFKCIQHKMLKREVCGTDAYAEFNRGDWGMTKNINYGPTVTLRIAAEAVEGDQPVGPPPGWKPPVGASPPSAPGR
ncbi:MAG TPA: YceI family protein [Steroidobacter sp.]